MNVESDLQTAAWIARKIGVGRAAVANWRKRYPDFPPPAAGGTGGPLFSWSAVQSWLVATGRVDQLAAAGRTGTGTQLLGDAAPGPDRDVSRLTRGELLARVLVSLLPRLSDDDEPGADDDAPVVLDPACRDATLLTAVAERFGDHVQLAAQAPDETTARSVRQALPLLDPQVGDALRADGFAATRGAARAVLCIPPTTRRWPASDLAADPRWRFGLPDPADADLAWVQHCLAHLRPTGVAVVVVSPVTAVRPSGRHVRAALVRAGVLRDVAALPDGLAPSDEGAVHLWVLRRDGDARAVRMVDLTGLVPADVPSDPAGWAAVFAAEDPTVIRAVPQVELLDGDTPLVPARHLRPPAGVSDLGPVTGRLRRLYADLGRALPRPAPSRPVARRPDVTLAELERSRAITILPRDATPRAGDLLFRTMGRDPVVADGTRDDERGVAQVVGIDTDRLDPHFVAVFVRADARAVPVANTHSALTREDVRRCRIPRMPVAEQRRYGEAFRRLQELNAVAARLAAVTDAVVTQTVHALTLGALDPAALDGHGTIDPPENEKRTS